MSKKDTLIVSLYAGPGVGKSTTMAGVFTELKLNGVNCEMAPEFAKEKVWEKSFEVLKNQIYLFAKQYHSIARLHGQVDVIITDSPLLLSLIYDNTDLPEFKDLVLAVNNKFRMLNYVLTRHKTYNPAGRMQNENEAIILDTKIKKMLEDNSISYLCVDAGKPAIKYISAEVLWILNSNKE